MHYAEIHGARPGAVACRVTGNTKKTVEHGWCFSTTAV